jgi:hypothetical protein
MTEYPESNMFYVHEELSGLEEDDEDEEIDFDSPDYSLLDNNNNTTKTKLKTVYEELQEKEQALILAAQFGKNLIDEKEELEKQIENLKRDHQSQLEVRNFENLPIFFNF